MSEKETCPDYRAGELALIDVVYRQGIGRQLELLLATESGADSFARPLGLVVNKGYVTANNY